ncbi:MAG: hypothetical protein A2042_07025 [Candidatus Schekmanbacteria bacterium GWA2_38_11]|uniref:Thioredoxin-like fold domain-containing protein n=1 Tax=Candidatus Schekmanbacteria bacterium GWA2_38_11 TaxID=1817876 RepID=A0A1F7RA40_9BACT|nr:MAG: hypothetical protein A2042_07025 [Candidatus Schekmanbacteria bacterium GWA2_38_11]
METKIKFHEDFKKAKKEAKSEHKLLFLFFHHPECGGCNKTINETFQDDNAVRMINERFIPMSFLTTKEKDLACEYGVEWTPSFMIVDDEGKELDRWEGFLPAEEFIPQLLLAEGLSYFRKQKYGKAISCLNEAVSKYPESGFTPQATYYLGICQYKESEDISSLRETYEKLHNRFPESYWTKKASPWVH